MTPPVPPTWAVVPSEGRACLHDCLASIRDQVDGIVLVANGGYTAEGVPGVIVVDDPSPDRNISRWWNLGLDRLVQLGLMEWNALVLNDDVVAPPHLVATLADALRSQRVAMAYPNQHDQHATIWREAKPVNLFHRITGYCFMLRGEGGLRADESLVWWAGDDDLDWRARQSGGAALVTGCRVEHQSPNGYTNAHPELSAQAGRDMETFRNKWGITPW